MPDRPQCPRCGAELSPEFSEGLCPRCLLELGLEPGPEDSEAEGTTEIRTDETSDLGWAGPYRLLSTLGEGGMGTVYLGEQREPIRRRLAIKIIKPGMSSKDAVARFESERQALALMSHPGIARIYDAGTTEDGRPYFVMEYVRGVPITEYCDKKRLDNRKRLGLFAMVCQAVQHAHQKGIIHRDIKPSNVLVTVEEGEPRPKVIDFGVAKALQQRLTEKTLFTQQGILVGTPGYMSPEQAGMSDVDIDTTTDIYSLGVLLYELLVGAPPFDPRRLRVAGWEEMIKIIREEEPGGPSTRVRTLGATATEVAEHRSTQPETLRKQLRGDLDWIVLKALEKDRALRYASATERAADIERHLDDEPVAAGPPSAAYRFQKLIRRHRVAFAATAAVFVALTAGLVVSAALYVRAEQARRETRQQVVHLNVASGMRLVDQGDLFGALPWLVEALKLEEGGPRGEGAHRYRIGMVLEQCPRLVHLWAHADEVTSAVFSPDGSLVATASRDKTARVWSMATGEPAGPPIQHRDVVNRIEFSPDGRKVVTASEDGTARVWDTVTAEPLTPPLRHERAVKVAAFSADRR